MLPEGHAITVAGIADFTFGGLALRLGLALTLILLANLFSLALLSRVEGVEAAALRLHLLGLTQLDGENCTGQGLLFFAYPGLAGLFVQPRLRAALLFGDAVCGTVAHIPLP